MTHEERMNVMNELRRTLGARAVDAMIDMGFMKAPASSRYHGCYEGGLFDHSYAVLKRLLNLTGDNKIKWTRRRSPFIVAMMHDLCKVDQYKKIVDPENGTESFEWQPTQIAGHGSKSLMLARDIMKLTREEEMCIRWHMGAFGDKSDQKGYSDAAKIYETVIWTHMADMLASHVDGI